MAKIGFSVDGKYARPMADVVKLLHDTGFDAISPLWQRGVSLEDTLATAHRCGMTVQSLHGPLRGLPGMWSGEEEVFRSIREDVLASAEACADFGIPTVVIHSWSGIDYSFREEDLCFRHFDDLVDLACRRGINVAFENLEGPEFLAALLERYRDLPNVGLCWDSGHEMCYAPDRDFLQEYGSRLLMTHLNDNYGITDPAGKLQGTDDLHLIPGQGIGNWEQILKRLKGAKAQEILNFELKIRPKGDRCKVDLYSKMPLEQFFREAYEAACSVAAGYFA